MSSKLYCIIPQSENVNLDPTLKESCQYDMETYCSDVQAGSGNILQCLKKYQDSLSGPCKKLIFKRQVSMIYYILVISMPEIHRFYIKLILCFPSPSLRLLQGFFSLDRRS